MMRIDIARAVVQLPDKGEDRALLRRIGDAETYLVAVADGLTCNGGEAAAEWAIEYLEGVSCTNGIHGIYRDLRAALSQLPPGAPESETTLTCGIVTAPSAGLMPALNLDYFAIGDSPIWKVISGTGRFPYQKFQIHGSPYPAETAHVYSTLRLHSRDVKGPVSFGSVEVCEGEVLVLCTDGLPEREVFIRDLSRTSEGLGGGSPSLCTWLFQASGYTNEGLFEILSRYSKAGLLFDDASIIAVRAFQDSESDSIHLFDSDQKRVCVVSLGGNEPIAVSDASNRTDPSGATGLREICSEPVGGTISLSTCDKFDAQLEETGSNETSTATQKEAQGTMNMGPEHLEKQEGTSSEIIALPRSGNFHADFGKGISFDSSNHENEATAKVPTCDWSDPAPSLHLKASKVVSESSETGEIENLSNDANSGDADYYWEPDSGE